MCGCKAGSTRTKSHSLNIATQGLINEDGFAAYAKEVTILAALEHENIVTFIGYSLEPTLLIVMEFVEGGTLSDYLAAQDPADPPTFREVMTILLGCAKAFKYLHAREPLPILHRDIKSENILVTKALEPRVADLGEARVMAENKTMTMGGCMCATTPHHRAPCCPFLLGLSHAPSSST